MPDEKTRQDTLEGQWPHWDHLHSSTERVLGRIIGIQEQQGDQMDNQERKVEFLQKEISELGNEVSRLQEVAKRVDGLEQDLKKLQDKLNQKGELLAASGEWTGVIRHILLALVGAVVGAGLLHLISAANQAPK